MNSVPLYITIGSILGTISAIVLLILHVPEVITTIRSFLKWFRVWLQERPTMIKKWYWWKKYRPSWEIASYGDVSIKLIGAKYEMDIPLALKFTSRNNRYHTAIDPDIFVDMYHSGKGWEKRPYRLLAKQIDRGRTFPTIAPQKSILLKYACEIGLTEKPLIADTVTCKIIDKPMRAGIGTPHERLSGDLKREGSNKFEAKALWEIGDDTNYTTE